MTTLTLRLLGPLEILSGDERMPKPATLKSQSLLAYLITHREQPQPREHLAAMFWGDRPEHKARSSLSTALWHVRRCLPAEDLLLSDRQSVQADPEADLWLDVDAFVARASQENEENLQSAVALYRGDFLDGFYDDWIINERYRLQALFARVLDRLMRLRETRGDAAGVLGAAKRLLRQDPLREDAHRAAMRAYCHLGRRNAALEQYTRCREMLRQELDASPMAATTALHREIRDGRFAAAPVPKVALDEEPVVEPPRTPGRSPFDAALSTELVGRERELNLLRARCQRAAAGSGGLILISGEAGVGKTRLTEALADRVRWRGGRVLWGRCYEFARGLPYQPFCEALHSALPTIAPAELRQLPRWVLEEIGRLVPDWSEHPAYVEGSAPSGRKREQPSGAEAAPTPESSLGRDRLSEAVARLLVELAAQSPLLLVLEDMHWAADATVRLLNHLARRFLEEPVLALTTYRPAATVPPHPLRDLERRLTRERLADRIRLPRLSAAATRSLLLQMSGASEDIEPLARRLHRETLGNPFFLIETVRSLFETDQLHLEEGVWRGDFKEISRGPLPLPAGMRQLIRARADRLGEAYQEPLHLAAVLGVSFDFDPLHRAWGQDVEDTLEALEAMLQRRLIKEGHGPTERDYAFTHHKIQEVIYRDLPRQRRQHLHGRVATTLEDLYGPEAEARAGELAHHFDQGRRLDEALTDHAIHYMLEAGDQARVLRASQEAIDWYERALDLAKRREQHERAARTLMKMGLTHHDAFQFGAAQAAYEEGFARWQRAAESRRAAPADAARSLRVSSMEPVSLDPAYGYDVISQPIVDQLFSGLLARGPGMELVPDVADSCSILDHGLRYIFHLRDDVRWSDGAPVTAGDFAYAWKRALSPEIGCMGATLLYDIRGARAYHQGAQRDPERVGVRATDKATLVVELEEPVGYFLHVLGNVVTYPVPQHVVKAHGESWSEPGTLATNGPFHLEAWRPGDELVLTANSRYHGPMRGNAGRVEVTIVNDPGAGVAAYDTDRLDVLNMLYFPPAVIDRARWAHAGEYVSGPPTDPSYVAFCLGRPPLDDRRVRRALALAVDRETLACVALRGTCAPAKGGIVPPSMPAHTPGLGPGHDPQRARDLLAEAGFPGGRGFPTMTLMTHADPLSPAASSYLAEQWQDVLGIACRPEAVAWEAFFAKIQSSPPHAVLWGWTVDYLDPDNVLRVGVGRVLPYTQWQHEDYTKLVERARRTRSQERRIDLYREAERLLMEGLPLLPLAHLRSHRLVKPWVTRLPMSPVIDAFWKDAHIEPH